MLSHNVAVVDRVVRNESPGFVQSLVDHLPEYGCILPIYYRRRVTAWLERV